MTFELNDGLLDHDNYIVGGLGGGADVVNAVPLYAYLRSKGKNVTLVGAHRYLNVKGGEKFTKHSKWVTDKVEKAFKTDGGSGRVFEPRLYTSLKEHFDHEEPLLMISRAGGPEGIAHALDALAIKKCATAIILIDGGGDALYTSSHGKNSYVSSDGDTLVIEALNQVIFAKAYVGIVAMGIDAPPDWPEVVKATNEISGYWGKYDLRSLPKDMKVQILQTMRYCLKFRKTETDRDESLTATTFWCAMNDYFKPINPLTKWCNNITPSPKHTFLRIFDADALSYIKVNFKTKIKNKHSNPYKSIVKVKSQPAALKDKSREGWASFLGSFREVKD